METLFPFGFPLPTAFYLTLYVVTLVVHVATMNYVLAGSAYLVWLNLRLGKNAVDNPPAKLLADWLPLMLSVAITAGIAPLLFIQILYRPQFYTANLLLFNRWMAILPVLIVAFYLLYLIRKPSTLARWPALRPVLMLVIFGCFGFIGWSWTENHLLSQQSQAVWSAEYGRNTSIFYTPELFPRLATWFLGAFPTLAIWLLWQLRWTGAQEGDGRSNSGRELRSGLARMASVMLVLAMGAGTTYFLAMSPGDREVLWSLFAAPWIGVAVTGAVLQLVAFYRLRSASSEERGPLLLATAGVLIAILGVTVVRETLRISRIDFASQLATHASAREIGGFVTFLVFAAINSALIVGCIRLTRLPPVDGSDQREAPVNNVQ